LVRHWRRSAKAHHGNGVTLPSDLGPIYFEIDAIYYGRYLLAFWCKGTIFHMQNRKAYIAVSFAVFGLIGACAPTGPRPAISGNAAPALAALSYSWKTDYAGVLTPPVEIQQKAHAACI
jgi:hypothetical protein